MGAAQSAGGAATSGARISGVELTHAIREAAKRDAIAAENVATDADASPQELAASDSFSFDYGLGDEQRSMIVTSYAPTVFARIRRIEGVRQERFLDEWTLPEERCQTALGEGRSMAMFLKSRSLEYMCKTIAEVEAGVLSSVLGDYLTHLRTHPDSLLMRFLMVLRIEANDDVGYLLVFSDSFAAADKLNERWDIKGRIPKPGKFRHFAPQAAEDLDLTSLNLAGTDADRSAAEAADASIVASRFSDGDEENPPASPQSHSIPTRKDKELTRLFWLEQDDRDRLLRDLTADIDFLCGRGLMDYSILVGVKYHQGGSATGLLPVRQDSHLPPPASPSATATAAANSSPDLVQRESTTEGVAEADEGAGISITAPSPDLGVAGGTPPPPVEVRPPRMVSVAEAGTTSRYHRGLPAMLGEEVYYIAIIDMLTLYNGKKMSANFFKGFLWEPRTLSTIPPPEYRKRIGDYAELIFASPDDDLTEIKAKHDAAA